MRSVESIIAHIETHELGVAWVLEPHVYADHLWSAALIFVVAAYILWRSAHPA